MSARGDPKLGGGEDEATHPLYDCGAARRHAARRFQRRGLSGAIHTTTSDGTAVNQNIYGSLDDPYQRRPQNLNAAGLPDGVYYFRSPTRAADALPTDNAVCRQLTVVNGRVWQHRAGLQDANDLQPETGRWSQLAPFSKTPNAGLGTRRG
jgi:hypothetical protein